MRTLVRILLSRGTLIALASSVALVFGSIYIAVAEQRLFEVLVLWALAILFVVLAGLDRRLRLNGHQVDDVSRRLKKVEAKQRSSAKEVEIDRRKGVALMSDAVRDVLQSAEGRRRLDVAEQESRAEQRWKQLAPQLALLVGPGVVSETAALADLFRTLDPDGLLPLPTDFSAAPSTIHSLVSEVLDRELDVQILECGSGSSTVWLAAACRKVGRGTVVALEHDEEYAEATRRALTRCGLGDFAEVRHAQLSAIEVEGQSFRWYNPDSLNGIERVDLLFVDGPPGRVGHLARYPAYPMTRPLLSDGALVVMDDATRDDERRSLELWRALPDMGGELLPTTGVGRAVHLRWRRQG